MDLIFTKIPVFSCLGTLLQNQLPLSPYHLCIFNLFIGWEMLLCYGAYRKGYHGIKHKTLQTASPFILEECRLCRFTDRFKK